jgi:hypothetical protein
MLFSLRSLLLFGFLCFCTQLSFGQCPPPGFPNTTSSCPTANLVCNLDGYCNLINNSNVSQNFPGCGNNVLNNDEWFAFYAGTSFISLLITPTNCAPGGGGSLGMQGGIYGACGTNNNNNSWQIVDTQCPCSTGPFTLSGNFTVGQIYYVVFDGCSGSVCDYQVDVTAGSTAAPAPAPPAPPIGPLNVCATGGNTNYTIPIVPFATGYAWSLNPAVGTVTPVGNGTSANVNFPVGTVGVVNVCVSSFNGCNPAGTPTCTPVNVIQPPTATISGSAQVCAGGGGTVSGSISVAFTGLGPWTFIHRINGVAQPPITTTDNPYVFTPTVGGTFTLASVTNNQGAVCTGTVSGTSTVTSVNVTATTQAVSATCGLSNGSINLTAGGTSSGPYTFLWSNGATDEDLMNIPSGAYSVTVSSPAGCTTVTSVNVSNAPEPITITGTTTPNTTCGTGNGAISVTITPSTAVFTWSNGAVDLNLTSLPPGSYTITATIGTTCSQTQTFTVANNPNNPTASLAPVGTTCNQDNGAINLTASGGVSPYTYLWSNGSTDPNLVNVLSGPYTVTVTGANDCTTTVTTTINNTNPPISVTGIATNNTTCAATGNGSINITVSPTGSYTYGWSTPSTDEDQIDLSPGSYTVTVTGTGTCTGSASFTITNTPINPTAALTAVGSTCQLDNGSVNLTVTGGVSPFTYLWSNGETGASLVNVLAGPYTVTVTGANDCTAIATTNVNNTNPPINVTGVVTNNTTCAAAGNGAINISVNPAGSYTYNWSTPSTDEDQTNLSPGSYTVTVTGAGSCTGTASFNVADLPILPTVNLVAIGTTCELGNGSVNLTVSGGLPPYTFLWDNGAATQSLSNVLAGPYAVTVTDANECTAVGSTNVSNVNPPININGLVTNNTTCLPIGNGAINITVTPLGSYTFNWTTPSTDEDQVNLSAGTYAVTVTGNGACTAEASFSVADLPNEPNAVLTAVAAVCGVSNGSINLTVSGGVAPYTYQWSNGATSQNLTGLTPGNYAVVVTGANGCTTTQDIDVNDLTPAINISGTTIINTTCNGGNGAVNISILPANPNYMINWSNGPTTLSNPNLPGGTYTVTVTLGNTCTQEESFTVIDNPNIPNLNSVITNTVCELSNGGIVVTPVSGGPVPFTYAWSNGTTNQNLSNVPSGQYSVVVTGANGCTQIFDFDIDNNNPPININGNAVANTSCGNPNGSITITVQPSGSYTYAWTNGASTQNITGLTAGTYTVTVTGLGVCQEVIDFTVDELFNLPTINATIKNPTCGLSNGSIMLMVSGGMTPYTYNWSGASGNANVINLSPGNYSVVVTDKNGCTATEDFVLIDETIDITLGVSIYNVTSCIPLNGGIDLDLTPSNLSVMWGHTSSTSASLTGLNTGTYNVTVSAGGTCTQETSIFVDLNTEYPELTINATQASCGAANGNVSVTAQFGDLPYTYRWSTNAMTQNLTNVASGTYTVTVTSASGCSATASAVVINNNTPIAIAGSVTPNSICGSNNGAIAITITPSANYAYLWSNTQNTASLTNVAPGTYTITVTSGPTCSAVSSFTVLNNATNPNLTGSTIDATCGLNNGSVNLTATGTDQPFTYAWTPSASSEDLANVSAGTYTVTVTNAGNCTSTAVFAVGASNLTLDITGTNTPNTSCSSPNGAVQITVSPAGTYTYQWSAGSSTSTSLTGLTDGVYTVTVSAGGTCSASATYAVTEATIPPMLGIAVTPAICNNAVGALNLTATGPNTPFSYVWTGGSLSGSVSTEDLTNIGPGLYQIVVTDATGCVSDSSLSVPNNASTFSLSGAVVQYTSCAAPNGAIDLNVTPAGAYTYLWNDGITSQDRAALVAGTYSVDVVQTGTCAASISFVIEDQRTQPVLTLSSDQEVCATNNGAIQATVLNSALPQTYLWSSGQSIEDLTGLSAGTYTLTITDANQCTATATTTVQAQSIAIDVSGVSTPNTSCAAPNGSIAVSITPAVPGFGLTYTYEWSNSAVTQDLNNLNSGNYTLTVTAGVGCISTASYTIGNQAGAPNLSASTVSTTCGSATGSLDLSVTDGLAPFTYSWSNGATSQDLNNLIPNDYSVTVTDANSCAATGNWQVQDQAIVPSVTGLTGPNTSCANPNGNIQISVSPTPSPVPGVNYTFLWSNNLSTPGLNNVGAGTYTVTVSLGVGCTNSAEFVVANNSGAPDLSVASSPALCGNAGGSINLNITSGVAPYTVLWSNSTSIEDPTGLVAGSYTVTVTDTNSCTTTATYAVANSSFGFSVTGSPQPNTSCASPNGSIALTINPTMPPGTGLSYTYLWSSGVGTPNLMNLNAATYTVTVTAGVGCTSTAQVVVANQSGAPNLSGVTSPSLCGNSGGSINLTISAGLAPYAALWSNTSALEDPTGLVAGSYTVTVTDANSCSTTATYAVANSSFTFSVSATPQANTSCASPNGSIDLAINPAMPPGMGLSYAYLWSSGVSTPNLMNLNSATYTVTVSAGVGCSSTAQVVVPNQSGAPDLSALSSPALCGNSDGSINLSISGGLAPYTALWSNMSALEDPIGLVPGSYTVTVTDANSCTTTATYAVANSSFAITVTGSPQPNNSCSAPNGSIGLSINPAVPPGAGLTYTYLWSTNSTTANQSNLNSGIYTVTVSTGVGCTALSSITVTNLLDLPVVSAVTNPSLCGNSAGSINTSLSGGLPPYTLAWSNSSSLEDISGLVAGTYTVTVTDGNGCQETEAFIVSDDTFSPTVSAATQANTSCANANGAIQLDVTPAGTYTYLWANGEVTPTLTGLIASNYLVTVSAGGTCTTVQSIAVPDASGAPMISGVVTDLKCFDENNGAIDITISGGQAPFNYAWLPAGLGTNPDLSQLGGGAYALIVTDALGCSSGANYIVNEPAEAIAITCFQTQQISAPGATDGKGRITISGGTAPYAVTWSPGNGVQNNFAGGDINLSNLAEGVYTTSVTDANGCTSICSFPISQQGCETELGTLSSLAESICGDGCITLIYSALGQFLDPNDVLQFILFEGASPTAGTEIARSATPEFCFNPSTMQYEQSYFIAVAAGDNDGNGDVNLAHFCTVVSAGTPVTWKRQPDASIAPVGSLNCAVDEVTLTGSSSLPLSSFQWFTLNGAIVGSTSSAVIQATAAGSYRLIVELNGCADTTIVSVADLTNFPEATITAQPGDLLNCFIDSIQLNGTIEGTLAPQFVWTVNNQFFANGSQISVMNPGQYQFILVDTVTFCTDTANITIQTNQNFPLLAAPDPDTLTCLVTSVLLTGSSPFANVDLKWARINGTDTTMISQTATAQVTQAGTYYLIGTDLVNSCVNALAINVISDQNAPTANAGLDIFIKCYGDTAMLDANGSVGNGPLSFSWSTVNGNIVGPQDIAQPTVSEFGIYALVVTQLLNGCTDTDDVNLSPLPIVAETEIENPKCENQKGVIEVIDPSGVPPVQFSIDGGFNYTTDPVFTGLQPGNYTIRMLDAEGCKGQVIATVSNAPLFTLTLDAVVAVDLGDSYQMMPVLNVPTTALSLIQWTPATFLACTDCLTPVATPLQSTTYQLFVRDTNGCERSAPISLEVDREFDVLMPNVIYPGSFTNSFLYPSVDTKTVKEIDIMRVFTRWGEEVFVQRKFPPNDPTYGWDGIFRNKELNPGVYVWYMEVVFIDGSKEIFSGDVTIVRQK